MNDLKYRDSGPDQSEGSDKEFFILKFSLIISQRPRSSCEQYYKF
jgi:hypothetical protein